MKQEVYMRDEDNRGGSNLITAEGLSRPLSYGERRCLEQQRKNREGDGMTPGQWEERNLRAISVDGDVKRPRFFKPGG